MIRDRVLLVAVDIAGTCGLQGLTRQMVAAGAEVSDAAVNYHFADMDGLREAVMTYAVKNECLSIIVDGLLREHPRALRAPEKLRRRAARYVCRLKRL